MKGNIILNEGSCVTANIDQSIESLLEEIECLANFLNTSKQLREKSNGVTISTERLLKSGFLPKRGYMVKDIEGTAYSKFTNDGFEFILYRKKSVYSNVGDVCWRNPLDERYFSAPPLRHIHDVQNLYLIKTGEELL